MGFTLVEVLIVVVVISILASISFSAANRIQADARDQDRLTRTTALAEALEKYYTQNGEYPSVAALISPNGATTPDQKATAIKNILGLPNTDILRMPRSSIFPSITASTATKDQVAYNGTSTNTPEVNQCQTNQTGGCDQFDLRWQTESGQTKEIASRQRGRIFVNLNPPKTTFTKADVVYVCSSVNNAPSNYNRIVATVGVNINGTSGNDIIYGTTGGVDINGHQGNDIICGGPNGDTLNGGDGEDILYGGNGGNTLNGGNGNDTLYAGNGGDELNGDNDNDILYGGTNGDTLNGGDGEDILYGGNGGNTLNGGNGNDTLYAGNGGDSLDGGSGNDRSNIPLNGSRINIEQTI